MKLTKKVLLLVLLLLGFTLTNNQKVNAQAINYQAYKYGTKQTSMASTYYVRPAQVEIKNNQYLVTMTIKTEKKLGVYPVKVLSIAGQSPFNIIKKRVGNDYLYSYSFLTSNLKPIINSKIFVSIPHVYTAYHNISFGFDTSNLPPLKSKAKNSTNTVIKAKSSKQTVNKENKPKASSPKTSKQKTAATSPDLKKAQLALAKKTLAQNEKNAQANRENQKMFYYVVLAGVLSSVVLLVSAVFFVLSFKPKKATKKQKK